MIQVQNACLSFGNQTIFNDASCNIKTDARIGLVGRNGSGKSTFLKALAGDQLLDSGTITLVGNTKIAYMPQDLTLTSKKPVIEELLTAYDHVTPENMQLLAAQAKKLLMNLGFNEEQISHSTDKLSTGWKMKLFLAQLLTKKADIYLFDEPTNHLDIFAQEWFLHFLEQAPFGFVLVCHERAFLNRVCTKILEIERGVLTFYNGSYDSYQEQKKIRNEQQWAAYHQQQKDVARKQATIERFRASASKAKMAQNMIKQLDRIEMVEPPVEDRTTLACSFPALKKSGRIPLAIKQLAQSFGKKQVFAHASFVLERGWKVALVAGNGVGKTTLLKTITNELQKKEGSITFDTDYSFFKQDQSESLDPRKTIWEEVTSIKCKRTDQDLRNLLGAFLFPGETIYKTTDVLSGGEKNRVSMVKTLLHDNAMLLLDEPTNHLDIQSKDVLLHALKQYPGTILFVSHDRDFVNKLATHVIELTPFGTQLYHGNYDDFLRQARPSEVDLTIVHSPEKKKPTQESEGARVFETKKKIRRLESKIEKLEKQLETESAALTQHEYGTKNYESTYATIVAIQQELDSAVHEWESLHQE